MIYKVGNMVRFAHLPGGGEVVEVIDDYNYQIEDDNGFINHYYHTQLLLDCSKPEYYIKPIKTNKDFIKKVIIDTPTKQTSKSQIDLHLKINENQAKNFSTLEIQLRMFQTAINNALLNKQKEITIIHGIGKGILKRAIIAEISKNRNILSFEEISDGCTKLFLKN